jgi:hypothetical protein
VGEGNRAWFKWVDFRTALLVAATISVAGWFSLRIAGGWQELLALSWRTSWLPGWALIALFAVVATGSYWLGRLRGQGWPVRLNPSEGRVLDVLGSCRHGTYPTLVQVARAGSE